VTTNIDIITDAYRMGNVIGMADTPSAELGEAGLRHLNDMLTAWKADTIDLGWFTQDDLTADAPLDDSSLAAVKSNLAVLLVGVAGMEPPAWVARQATKTYDSLLRIAVSDALEEADMSHMPSGSGRRGRFDIDSGWN
jgi:hypothetical protein